MNINPKIVLAKISETPETPSLGIYTRDSNGNHNAVYLQHPNRSTKDEPAPLRVPPVALPPQD
jgi:hypothetical protein